MYKMYKMYKYIIYRYYTKEEKIKNKYKMSYLIINNMCLVENKLLFRKKTSLILIQTFSYLNSILFELSELFVLIYLYKIKYFIKL